MREEKIVLHIGKDGTPTIRVEGICGEGCKDLSRPFEQAIGAATDDQPTDEMYATQTTGQEVNQ